MPSSRRNLIFFLSVEVLIMGGYRFSEWFRRQYEGKRSPNAARVRLALPKSRFASLGLPLGPLYFIGLEAVWSASRSLLSQHLSAADHGHQAFHAGFVVARMQAGETSSARYSSSKA